MHPRMVVINPGWLSLHPGIEIDASRVGIPGWRSMHPGWRSKHPGWRSRMEIDASMVIDASGGGDRYTTGWRRSLPGWRSMHPGMASRDRDRCIQDGDNASQDGYHCIPGWRSRDGDRCRTKCRLRIRSSELTNLGKQPGFSVVYLHFQGALVTVTCALSACTR